jgi:cyclase
MNYHHFTIHELASGIYAAIHKEGGAAYSNAGIIDLGDRTLIFDAFDMVVAAKELLKAAKELTGRHPTWLVNSHKHGDHWGGNQVFADKAVILSTHHTRSGMLKWGAEIESLKENSKEVEQRIQKLEKKLLIEKEPLQRSAMERNLKRNKYLLADLPYFHFCPPSVTFAGRMVFHGTKRVAELVTAGPSHTPEECYLVLEEEKIIFTGDLAFFACPPFMAPDCDPNGWMEKLSKFIETDYEIFVPGHGRIGDKSDLKREKEYIYAMRNLVRREVKKNKPLKDVMRSPLPDQFKDWTEFIARNENNLRTLYDQLIEKK